VCFFAHTTAELRLSPGATHGRTQPSAASATALSSPRPGLPAGAHLLQSAVPVAHARLPQQQQALQSTASASPGVLAAARAVAACLLPAAAEGQRLWGDLA
jgi:hypothetical protein